MISINLHSLFLTTSAAFFCRWKLTPTELNLLCNLVKACIQRGTTSADIPVYLPHTSSRVPHRLVVFCLLQGCQVLLLLGPEPPLSSLLPQVPRYWNVVQDRLDELQTLAPSSIAPCHVSLTVRYTTYMPLVFTANCRTASAF